MPAGWYGLRADHLYNEWWHANGGAVPEALLESTWSRVEAEDEAMHIGKWAARKRKATWQARFAVAIIARCNYD